MIGAGQTGRARAHHRYPFGPRRRDRYASRAVITRIALEGAHVDRSFQLGPVALLHAETGAYPPTDRRQGRSLEQNTQCAVDVPAVQRSEEPLHVIARRADEIAGWRRVFTNGLLVGPLARVDQWRRTGVTLDQAGLAPVRLQRRMGLAG